MNRDTFKKAVEINEQIEEKLVDLELWNNAKECVMQVWDNKDMDGHGRSIPLEHCAVPTFKTLRENSIEKLKKEIAKLEKELADL